MKSSGVKFISGKMIVLTGIGNKNKAQKNI